jgi:hypothetical protein
MNIFLRHWAQSGSYILEKMGTKSFKFRWVAIAFLPLLLVYIIIVVKLSSNTLQGDQANYLFYAGRILTGKYFSDPSDIHLWWGIGYPLVLVPFVALNFPLFTIKLLNSIFLYSAILYLYATLKLFIPPIRALAIAFLAGLYLPFLSKLYFVSTETFVYFLVCGLIYYFCQYLHEESFSGKNLLLASLFFGWLALTKIFFGYVIAASIGLFGILFLLRRNKKIQRSFIICTLAMIWCVPYLIGTYSLTGNIFYWGTSGGESLYWMSTPYLDEMGDWFADTDLKSIPELNANHGAFFEKIASLSEVQKDAAFKQQASVNILGHPIKYFYNWLANLGRLFFDFPFSYQQQRIVILLYFIPNSILITLILFSLIPAFLRWNRIPFEIKALSFISVIAFFGSSLLSAYARMLTPLVPFCIIWIVFIYLRLIEFHLLA